MSSSPQSTFTYQTELIPFLLEAAAVLATFAHPNHIVYLCSWGFTLLPPTCNSKSFWYRQTKIRQSVGKARLGKPKADVHHLNHSDGGFAIHFLFIFISLYSATDSTFRY
ncbi:hypothetical protein C1Y48_15040 [Vibrio cholerae]|nr:hypothetical protein [Vibrio cholerae]PKQ55051.1 hypothetical protein CR151_00090 [Vibrio cholerae]PNV70034.1 hypothetical protein C1Y48_15040 [Vibrio cholerae]